MRFDPGAHSMSKLRSFLRCCGKQCSGKAVVVAVLWILVASMTGCGARLIYGPGDSRFHPSVKWVLRSGDQLEYFALLTMLMQEDFDDAGLYGDKLVLCSWGGGDMAHSYFDNIHVVSAEHGTVHYSISVPTGVGRWYVTRDRRLVLQLERRDIAYDLDSGRRVSVPASHEEEPSQLEEIRFRHGPDPPERMRDNIVLHTLMADISPRLRLIEKPQDDPMQYSLHLEIARQEGDYERVPLVQLRRRSGAGVCWVARDSFGDYTIVLGNGFVLKLQAQQ